MHIELHMHYPGRFLAVDLVGDGERLNLTNAWAEPDAQRYADALAAMIKVPVRRAAACPTCDPVTPPPPGRPEGTRVHPPAAPPTAPAAPAPPSSAASADEAPV
jgi:hypothetical protein